MFKRYENVLQKYKIWHPSLYERTVECRPSGRQTILVGLNDGSKLEFNAADNTVRNVTRFYTHDSTDELTEETWRKEFGHKLRRAISDKGITQEQLSQTTGISRQMLTRYVRGMSTPSGYILSRLVEALNCDIRELTKFGYIDEE